MSTKDNTVKIQRGNTGVALKAGLWYVISTFLVKALAFITTPIFSRIMSESDYGEFSNYAYWQSILLIIIGLEMFNTLSRAYFDYSEEYDEYVSSVVFGTWIISALFYIIFLVSGQWLYNIISIPKEFIHILFFTMAFQSCKSIYLARERTFYRYKSVAVISILSLVVPTLISVILVLCSSEENKLPARIYGFYVPYALIGVYCAGAILLKRAKFKWKYVKYAIWLGIPLLIHALTAYVLTSTNIIITKSMAGAAAAAKVSIAASAMQILTMLFQAINGALTMWIMDKLEQKDPQSVKKCGVFFSWLAALVVIGVMLVAPELISILGGSKYADSLYLIPPWAFSIQIQTITTICTIILTYDKNVVKSAVVTGITAAASIGGKILIYPSLGYEAFPYVNIVAFAIIFVGNYIFVLKSPHGNAIDLKGMLLPLVISGGFVALSFVLYDNRLIRYAVILSIIAGGLLFLYKTKNIWKELIKKKKKA